MSLEPSIVGIEFHRTQRRGASFCVIHIAVALSHQRRKLAHIATGQSRPAPAIEKKMSPGGRAACSRLPRACPAGN